MQILNSTDTSQLAEKMTSAVPQLEEHLGPKRRQPTSRAKFLDEKNGNYADETSQSQEVSTPSNYPLP
jgi:hypothetical protein